MIKVQCCLLKVITEIRCKCQSFLWKLKRFFVDFEYQFFENILLLIYEKESFINF